MAMDTHFILIGNQLIDENIICEIGADNVKLFALGVKYESFLSFQ